jgi:hypothetical protein
MDRGFKAYWQTQPSPAARTKSIARPLIAAQRRQQQPSKILAAAPDPKMEQQKFLNPVSATVIDSLLWHGAASLALPFVVINRYVFEEK